MRARPNSWPRASMSGTAPEPARSAGPRRPIEPDPATKKAPKESPMSHFTTPAAASPADDGRHAFDFFIGRWKVAHHRLRERLVSDTHWENFAGACETRHIIGGLGNLDDN